MDVVRFWSIVDAAREAGEPASKELARSLARLPAEEIIAFDEWFRAYFAAVNREDLWAAVYAIRGGCSDDGFEYFCSWLVSRGEAVVRAAIEDPESLDLLPSLGEDELMRSAARTAYRRVAKTELPDARWVTIPGRETWPEDRIRRGMTWSKGFYAKLFPTLYAKYVAPHDGWEEDGEIDEPRFWALVDEARRGATTIAEVPDRLRALLAELPNAEVIGAHRWMRAYEHALRREDVAVAARVLLGTRSAADGLSGWLIAQGRGAVHAAMHDLDALLEHAQHPPAVCVQILGVARAILLERGVKSGRELHTIPDHETWARDWEAGTHTVAELRAKLPRLTASFADVQLFGETDVTRRSPSERDAIAQSLVRAAQSGGDDRVRLDQLDQALRLWPTENTDKILELRGAVHARLGNFDAARADLDAVLSGQPFAHASRWARSQVRLALGDRAGALADAREVAPHVDEARAWLITQAPTTANRVRHPKFGEGDVVSADTTGGEPTFVVDFAIGRKKIATRFLEPIG